MTIDKTEAARRTKVVADQLHTILFRANVIETKFYSPTKKANLLSLSVMLSDKQKPDVLIADVPEVWELSDERVKLLGKLYLSLDQFDRNTLASMAHFALTRQSIYAKHSAYLFTFVAKYHSMDTAIDWVLESLTIDEIGMNALGGFSNLLKYDPGLPSDSQLDRIPLTVLRKWEELKSAALEDRPKGPYTPTSSQVQYDRFRSRIMRIAEQAQEIKYRRLRDRLLNDANLEINQDRQILTTSLAKLGFPKELVESLEHAEAEYRKAESKFDFKTSVDHNRSFFEALMWETAGKVAKARNEQLTARQKFPVEVRDYLHKAGFLSDKFYRLCDVFYGFASEQSTHQLASGREIARVVRNLNIELGMLIVQRVHAFK